MREIKFRAWCNNMKMMIYEGEQCGHVEYDTNPLRAVNMILNEDDYGFDFMQYTGSNTKDGKEIYEGDILKASNGEKGLYTVVWSEHENGFRRQYKFIQKYKGKSWEETSMLPIHSNYFKVVGNIYEDKHLLED